MTTKYFLRVSAIIGIAFGLGLLIFPAKIIAPYMIDDVVSEFTKSLGMAYGTLLIGVALMLWMARNANISIARKAIITGIVLADALVGLVHIYAILNGIENKFAWGTVVLVFLLAIWGIKCLAQEKMQTE